MTRLRLLSAVPVAVVVLAASLAACGGSDGGTTASDPGTSTSAAATAITKADFLSKGNAICQQGTDAINAAGDEVAPGDTEALDAFVTGVVLPDISMQIDQLKALGYPDGDQTTLDGIYGDAQVVITSLMTDPTALVTAKTDADSPFVDVNKELVAYGLTSCGT